MSLHKRFWAFISLILLIFCSPVPVFAEDDNNNTASTTAVSTQEPYAGDVLCPPDAYLQDVQDCLPLGPSESLTEYAEQGIQYPTPPLPAYHTPLDLATIPYNYIKVTYRGAIPVYSSEMDAIANNVSREIPTGFNYFSYSERSETDDGIYYKVKTGEWVWGGYVSRVNPPTFEGFVFYENPKNDFGWILETTTSRKTPGYDGELTGKEYYRFDVVYVYQTQTIEDTTWYLIGSNEWVEKKTVARVTVNPIPPEGVENNRWIELDLDAQVVMVYEQGKLLFATLASSGEPPSYTKPGLFKIYKKVEGETMSTGNKAEFYFLEDVPFTMYFDEGRALHGAYWHSKFGYVISHGCVNLSIADSHWLYNWADIGDYVYVWDPSGKTPTDPSFYTEGGGP